MLYVWIAVNWPRKDNSVQMLKCPTCGPGLDRHRSQGLLHEILSWGGAIEG